MEKHRVSKGIYYFVPTVYEDSFKYQVVFRALSVKELDSLTSILDNDYSHMFGYQVCRTAVLEVIDTDGASLTIDSLSPTAIAETSTKILSMSSLPDDEYVQLQTTIAIAFDDTFQSNSWKCSECKRKRLDKLRNCGFLGEKDKSSEFSIMAGRQLYTYCPIYDVEPKLLQAAVESYSMYDKGLLPDEGGLYDQTRFFVTASKLVQEAVRQAEIAELKKNKNK